MPRKKTPERKALKYRLETRVNEAKYKELTSVLEKTMNMDMSSLLRQILHHRPVKIYTHDKSMDMLMEELTRLRAEIKAIGVNINQITRWLNTYPQPALKAFYAKIGLQEYLAMQVKVNQLLDIINQLAKKWLSK